MVSVGGPGVVFNSGESDLLLHDYSIGQNFKNDFQQKPSNLNNDSNYDFSLNHTSNSTKNDEYDPHNPKMIMDDADKNWFVASLRSIQQTNARVIKEKDNEIHALREKIRALENELSAYRVEKAAQNSFFERDMTSRCPANFFSETPKNGYVCNNCGIPGHFIQNCPQKKRPPIGYVCKNCFDSSRDHFFSECPHPKQKRQCFNISPTI